MSRASQSRTRNIISNLTSVVFRSIFFIFVGSLESVCSNRRERNEKTEEGSQLPRYPSGVKSDRETSQILISPPSAPFGAHSQLGVFALF